MLPPLPRRSAPTQPAGVPGGSTRRTRFTANADAPSVIGTDEPFPGFGGGMVLPGEGMVARGWRVYDPWLIAVSLLLTVFGMTLIYSGSYSRLGSTDAVLRGPI